jgi:ATP-dependent Clp protease ATP-binding subunit ClpA
MTSNVGSDHFRKLRSPLGFLSGEMALEQVQSDIRGEVERRFSPEFLNRIDDVVLFSPLTPDEARTIAVQYLSILSNVVTKAGKTITIDDAALDALVKHGHNVAYGARFLKRAIDDRVKLPISTNWHQAHFHVRVDDGGVVVDAASFTPGAEAVA